jgi:hypothetical protein
LMAAQRFHVDGYSPENTARGWTEEFKFFLKRNPQIANMSWRYDNEALRKGDWIFVADQLLINLKSGGEELFTIKSKSDLAGIEKKYGKLPLLPPPPPMVNPILPSPPVIKEKAAGQRAPAGGDSTKGHKVVPDDYQLFMERNPQVKNLSWQQEDTVIITLKSGEQEKYVLKDDKSLEKLTKKYGKLPGVPPPPPVPPVPPVPPAPPSQKVPPRPALPAAPALPPVPQVNGYDVGEYNPKAPGSLPEGYLAFLKRNPQVEKVRWHWEKRPPVKPVQAIVILKSGGQEIYKLNSASDMAGAERKYGKLPWPASPIVRHDTPPKIPVIEEKPIKQE